MNNPFQNRVPNLSGPATDIVPVSPSDAADLETVALALYVETGGDVVIKAVNGGAARTVTVADFSVLPVGVARVYATGTTATGIHAMVLA